MGSTSTVNSLLHRIWDLSLCCDEAALVTGTTTEASTPKEIVIQRDTAGLKIYVLGELQWLHRYVLFSQYRAMQKMKHHPFSRAAWSPDS